MLPADFTSAWTNVRPSLHRLSGCFKGGEQQNNEIGEFHALITLDSGETQRAFYSRSYSCPITHNKYLPPRPHSSADGWPRIHLQPGEALPKV